MMAGQSHVTSIIVKRASRAVFDLMADPRSLNRWSFGTWETEIAADGLVLGASLFDGAKTYVRIEADEKRLSIDYHLGQRPETLVPRIMVRVVPGPMVGLPADQSVLTLLAWRSQIMDENRWRKLTASHEMEVVLIKALLEREAAEP